MKIALGISYFGYSYLGWQKQNHTKNTIQYHVDKAISKVANHNVTTICAGRTDKGVHATGQIIHFETSSVRENIGWQLGINKYLPGNICVNWSNVVNSDFHARFSATYRRYQYIIQDNIYKSAIFNNLLFTFNKDLDESLMHIASQYFLGEQDFSSFRASKCQSRTPFRNIKSISVSRNSSYIIIDITANAFLYHMVRNIVGALLLVGQKKKSPDWILSLLEKKDRNQSPATAPPYGLYLVEVGYEKKHNIPQIVLKLPFL